MPTTMDTALLLGGHSPRYRSWPTTTDALCPPKPKLFMLMGSAIAARVAVLGV